jgi:hypothetical protein
MVFLETGNKILEEALRELFNGRWVGMTTLGDGEWLHTVVSRIHVLEHRSCPLPVSVSMFLQGGYA